MFSDLYNSLRKPGLWAFTTWFKFLIRYRRTAIGPLWIIASPLLFIFCLGALFVGLSNFTTSEFIPHLTIGLVVWTLIGGYLTRSHNIFQRNRAFLMQGKVRYTDVILIDNSELIVHFLHQCIIIAGICLFYGTISSWSALLSLVGLFLVIVNGFWMTIVFGILGARYRDIGEIITAIVSIAFLATPIIWMPVQGASAIGGKGSILQTYMTYNPFYHFLEVIRSPLMGNTIQPLTWGVVGGLTVFGFALAAFMYSRYRHHVVFWT